MRPSVKPQYFTYKEMVGGILKDPWKSVLRMGPSLAWRFLAGKVGLGNGLIVGLTRGCLDHGCEIRVNADVKHLLQEGGARHRRGGGDRRQAADDPRRARASCWRPAASTGRRTTCRNISPACELIGAPRSNTGDGQRMAAEAGAELDRMDQANIAPVTFTGYEGHRHAQPLYETYTPHCILVNRNAERFVSEGSASLGSALDERGPDGKPKHLPVWRIFDSRYKHTLGMHYASKDPAFVRSAPTLEALAEKIGLDPAKLRATVERFNGWSKEGVDRDFHRGETAWERYYTGTVERALGTVEQAPFFAAPFLYASLGTKGGARTNARCEVLRPDRSVIGGLYCAGIAMAHPIGTKAVGAGTTIGPCLTFGYIAGKSIARRNV